MPRIRCRYIGCIHLDNGLCGAPVIELDPDEGCRSFTLPSADLYDEDEWDEDEMDNWDEGYDDDDEDDDDWMDDDDY